MKILVTGGAGFIGSNIVQTLLSDQDVEHVTVIDNLISGSVDNIKAFFDNPRFTFVEGDIRDLELCKSTMEGHTHVCHQAALGSVPRSIKNPVATNGHNIDGTLNILESCRFHKVDRLVFASSSSVYGDDKTLPKIESETGNVLSPYALTKKTKEQYARLYSELYDLSIAGFRYFNVFGPKQSPKGVYAAVIPLFIDKLVKNEQATIHGDGEQSRDFTYIDNVVSANVLALKKDSIPNNFQIYNIALGEKTSVNQLYNKLAELVGKNIKANHTDARTGDIKHSLADISKIKRDLNYRPLVNIDKGLEHTVKWFLKTYEK